MASTAVRYPTPQRVDGSTQHTSVEVTDPLLWQGQRQARAEGGTSTPQFFNFVLVTVRVAKATCPSDTPSTMVDKWEQHYEPAGGLMLSWARASRLAGGRFASRRGSALGRFEARASSVRPLAPPAGRVQQAWQRHPGATQLFYLSTPPRYARQSSCSSTSRALRASAPNHRCVQRTQRNA